MEKFEPIESSDNNFSRLSDLLGGKDHVKGTSSEGNVYINRHNSGHIFVVVHGHDRIVTSFTVTEDGNISASAEKAQSFVGGGITEEHENLRPEFDLSNVLSTFTEGDIYGKTQ